MMEKEPRTGLAVFLGVLAGLAVLVAGAGVFYYFVIADGEGQSPAYARAAVVEDLEGSVVALSGGRSTSAFKGMALLYQDIVETGLASWTCIELTQERFVLVEENSNVLVSEMADSSGSAEVMLTDGKIWVVILSELGEDESFEVKTPSGSMVVRGTVFAVEADGDSTRIAVYDGTVNVSSGGETLDATLEAVEISGTDDAATDISRTELTEEDMAPLVLFGEAGPGGVFEKLRGLVADDNIGYVTIKGEQYSIALTRLVLNNMELTDADIAPLEYMTNLIYLRLDYNQISDIAPLAVMSNLTEVNLGNNRITDISPLRNLEKLTQVYLNDNDVADWMPVEHVPNVYGRP